jgi:hypothetical protein
MYLKVEFPLGFSLEALGVEASRAGEGDTDLVVASSVMEVARVVGCG